MSAILGIALSGTVNTAANQIFAAATAKNTGVTDLPPVHKNAAVSAAARTDQVALSKQAQALLLYSQGHSATEISATLGLPPSIVTSYLGITNGVQSVTDAATAVVEAQQALTTPTIVIAVAIA